MAATVEIAAGAVLFCGCAAAWLWVRLRRPPGGTLLQYEPRRPVPWDMPVIVPVVLLFLGVRIGSVYLANRHIAADAALSSRLQELENPQLAWNEPGYARPMFQAAAISQFITAAAIAAILTIFFHASRDDLGFSTRRWAHDLRLGVLGFFALAVPALLLQGALQWLVTESQHPIVLAFRNSKDGSAFLWAAVAAVVVAPAVEEFLFRGVLQGMFERIWGEQPASPVAVAVESPSVAAAEAPSFAPVVASAAIFALMHLSSGIDVVPLFFLALGLGYLYRQTHRLWPGIVVHSLLNAFSMAMLLVPNH